jgi:biopolymer transport protein ExbD
MKLPRANIKRGRVEIIPMIDTILILLIFYMSFAKIEAKEKRIDAKLPIVTTRVAPTQVPLDVGLHVKDGKHIVVNEGAVYDAEGLRAAMNQLKMIGQDITVVIAADPDTDYQAVIAALDACALANLTKVAFRPLSEKTPTTTP